MPGSSSVPIVRWYRSLYFRIGFGFVTFVVALLFLQGLLLQVTRRPPLRGAPNIIAALVAADLTEALSDDPGLDLGAHLKRQYAQSQPIYVVMKDGATASNASPSLPDGLRQYAMDVIGGRAHSEAADSSIPPVFVTVPIQLKEGLAGLVLLPPAPLPSPLLRDVQRLTTLPSTAALIVLTVIAAAAIFEPARRRMAALRAATQRLGSGDLSARAPVSGDDEVAELSVTFNKMAADLSAREDALRRSDHLRRQMLADVSHELKTPLTAMRGYVETLHRQDISLDEITRERYFQTLERETERLDRIVKDLLDLGRIENGAMDLDVRVFDVRRLLEHVVRRHEREVDERGIEVGIRVDDGADQMVGDPNRIEQLIENLYANALRHVPDSGAIDLTARLEDHVHVLRVEDSGRGISEEHLPYVFERFYKVDAARATANGGGSGLGLSISKAIVERHGGSISVKRDRGRTIFESRFPLERDGAGSRTVQAASMNL